MSSTTPKFAKQQELANKRVSDLDDQEKIYLLKAEVHNLRTQIREGNDAIAQDTSSGGGFCSNGLCRAPVLTIFLALGVVLVARWRRRQSIFSRLTSSSTTSTKSSSTQEMTMTFELQDAHEYEAPTSAAVADIRLV